MLLGSKEDKYLWAAIVGTFLAGLPYLNSALVWNGKGLLWVDSVWLASNMQAGFHFPLPLWLRACAVTSDNLSQGSPMLTQLPCLGHLGFRCVDGPGIAPEGSAYNPNMCIWGIPFNGALLCPPPSGFFLLLFVFMTISNHLPVGISLVPIPVLCTEEMIR